MNNEPGDKQKHHSRRELRHIDDTYVFDISSGLYKPKAHDGHNDSRENPTEILWKDPVPVKRDWVTIVISALTLAFLIIYTHHAGVQANMAQIGAAGTIEAARAARDAVEC
jgi:hypothetical protein